jgi:hypothetical protein
VVLAEKVVGVAANRYRRDGGAPVLTESLRIFRPGVHPASILARGAFERDAAIRIERIRGSSDDRTAQPAVGREYE